MPVDYLPPGESPSEAYPFVLITGRILQHYNCGAQTRRTGIMQVVDTDVLEMHPMDAESLGLRDGDSGAAGGASGLRPACRWRSVNAFSRDRSSPVLHFPDSQINMLLSSSADWKFEVSGVQGLGGQD